MAKYRPGYDENNVSGVYPSSLSLVSFINCYEVTPVKMEKPTNNREKLCCGLLDKEILGW